MAGLCSICLTASKETKVTFITTEEDWYEAYVGAIPTLTEINTTAAEVAEAVRLAVLGTENPLEQISPGYLGLGYGNIAQQHKTRVRLTFGTDPNLVSVMATEADLWATAMSRAISNEEVIDTFYVYDSDGELLYSSLLPSAHQGQITAHGFPANSISFTLTGRGLGGVGLNRSGEALTRMFPFSISSLPPRGTKFALLSSEPGLLLTAQALAVSPYIWADYNGYKAGIRGRAPFQMNSSTQNREGF